MEETKIMEDFVPRDIALLLKEKGYDWDCRQVYDLMTKETNTRVYFNFEDRNPNRHKDLCSAPSLAEARKWLRMKGIVITIGTPWPCHPEICKIPYNFLVEDFRPERDMQKEHGIYHTGYSSGAGMDDFLIENGYLTEGLGFGEFMTYEKAESAAVRFCLTRLKWR